MIETCPICGEEFEVFEEGGCCELCGRQVCDACSIFIDDIRCEKYNIICADCIEDLDCSDEVIDEAIEERWDYIERKYPL